MLPNPLCPTSKSRSIASGTAQWCAAWALLGLSSLSIPGVALAQITPMPPGGDAIAHKVIAGDTLEQLANRYLGDRNRWTALQAHNRVADPFRLRPGSVLEIPTRLLRAATASVEFVRGDVRSSRSLNHLGENGAATSTPGVAQAVQKGQSLQEGDLLKIAPDAFVSVRLADGSLVRVQSESEVQLRQMRRKGRAGNLQSVLDLSEGGLEISVPKLANGERRFEVRTPAASTSVRGTQFLVQNNPQGNTTAAVDEGLVSVQSGQPSTLLRPGQGIAVSEKGQLSHATRMLPAPDISTWPALAEDAHWISLPLPVQTGAVRYQVQLARDQSLTEVLRSAQFTQSPLRLTGVDDGDYVVAIRGVDASGIPGSRSLHALRVKAHPMPPLYEAPAQDGTVGQGQSGLQCTQVTEASAYRIQVAAAGTDFKAPVLDARDLKDCVLPAQALAVLPLGSYQWRAASLRTLANGELDQGPFAAPQNMKLAQVPQLPQLQIGGSAGEGSRNIRWAGEEGQRYHLIVATEQSFAAPLLDTWIDQPQWSTEALPAGSYYLKMQVQDSNGLRSNFTDSSQFQTGNWVTGGDGQMLTTGDGSRLSRQ